MSPRTLVALASATLVAAACARATSPDFDETDDAGTTSSNSVGGNAASGTPSSNTSVGPTSGPGTGGAGNATSGTAGMGSTTSAGGMGGSGGMPTTTSGSGGNTSSCIHDVCTFGPALTIGCGDSCVDIVCNDDDYCCDTQDGEWDDICIDSAVGLCGASCSTGGGVLPGDLVITEIMNNPAAVADAAGEWFEVFNDSGASIDLQGLVIRHQSMVADPNATVSINQSVVVLAGDYAVLGLNGNQGTNGGVVVDFVYPSAVNLGNTSDYLAIEDGSGTVIDEVTYNESSGLDPNGKSRSLNPAFSSAFDNDDDTHFCEATSLISGGDAGTPGAANDSCP